MRRQAPAIRIRETKPRMGPVGEKEASAVFVFVVVEEDRDSLAVICLLTGWSHLGDRSFPGASQSSVACH